MMLTARHIQYGRVLPESFTLPRFPVPPRLAAFINYDDGNLQ